MKVKCVANSFSKQEILIYSNTVYLNADFHVSIDKEYLVLGLTLSLINYNQVCFIEHISDYGHIVSTPLSFFRITKNKSSNIWILKIWENNEITLWPKLFYEDCFHDNFSEGDKECIDKFKTLYKELESENLR